MRDLFTTVGLLLLLGAAIAQSTPAPGRPAPEQTDPFKLVSTLASEGQETKFTIYFFGKHAVEFADGVDSKPVVIYDLGADSWREMSPARSVKLSDCEAWAKASAERSRASLTKVKDADLRRFLEGMLDPKFVVTAEKGRLQMVSDVLRYDVRSKQSPPKAQRDLLYAYDRLNAYRKAMQERKFPPFAQLAVTKELSAREMWPSAMTMEVSPPKGKVRLQVNTEVQALTTEERARVKAVVSGPPTP